VTQQESVAELLSLTKWRRYDKLYFTIAWHVVVPKTQKKKKITSKIKSAQPNNVQKFNERFLRYVGWVGQTGKPLSSNYR